MLLRLPTSVSEASRCLSEGAIPVGGATLVWAAWQRDGFPEQAVSLRDVPEARVIGAEEVGAAVVLNQIDERVPEVLRRAAAGVGTGAVRRAATVGGNLVGSTLRCLLPAALVLDARAVVLDADGTYETDLAEVVAKRPLLLSLRWSAPLACAYRKLPAKAGGEPPSVAAAAVHAGGAGGVKLLRVAVREGYEVLTETVPCGADAAGVLDALARTQLGTLSAEVRELLREQVAAALASAGER
ncbi:FAD binding domain-containing protein [Streptomyces sp. NPDC086787]|uniref:FAD binding domain-containing protein n=1 Tax=Streptomyces sp. NPDC086787 TaxID=3365759 RepID=UPI0037FEB930